jgi:hypothetical protein
MSSGKQLFHVRRIELEIILSFFLGAVHGRVGVFHERLLIVSIFGINADADAGRHAAFPGR